MSKDPRGGRGKGSGYPAWGRFGAARKASWKRRASASRVLKKQEKPPSGKGRKRIPGRATAGEARRREGKAEGEQEHDLRAWAGSEGSDRDPHPEPEMEVARPPTGFPIIACVWPTNWLLLTAAGSQRGSRDQFPAELSREKTSTFNHQIQRPPGRQLEVTSWESRSQSLLGPRETRPDPKADRCSSDACEDATEQGHRCDTCSQRQFTPNSQIRDKAQRGGAAARGHTAWN